MVAISVVNGTDIVPIGFPTSFRPDQLDKLGFTASMSLAWPTLIGGVALLLGTRDWRKYSYTPLAILWMWSVSLVGYGIFMQFGIFNHVVIILAVLHVQTEWLIITFLLGYSFSQAYINASVIGIILTIAQMGIPGIRGAFAVLSILGGFGDVFIPVLLWHGGQKHLALGGIGHFFNALVTFIGFTYYIRIERYFVLQLIASFVHAFFTVSGIFHLHYGPPPAWLVSDDESLPDETGSITTMTPPRAHNGNGGGSSGSKLVDAGPNMHRHNNGYGYGQSHGKGRHYVPKPLIPPLEPKEAIKLALLAFGLSLLASLPLNFAPK